MRQDVGDVQSSGDFALHRSSRLHKRIVGVSIALTTGFGFLLASLHPGVSTKSGSSTALSSQAQSATAGLSPGSTSATLVPVPSQGTSQGSSSAAAAPAPLAASGGS